MKTKAKSYLIGAFSGVLIGFFLSYICLTNAANLFNIIGGLSGLVAGLFYLCRTYVEFALGVESEQLKIKFSKTYELRADVIAEAHGKLCDLFDATEEFSQRAGVNLGSKEWNEASERVRQTRDAMIDFLFRKQLYLPKDSIQKIRDLFLLVHGAHVRRTFFKDLPPDERSQAVQDWMKQRAEIPKHIENLENAFRNTLGFLD